MWLQLCKRLQAAKGEGTAAFKAGQYDDALKLYQEVRVAGRDCDVWPDVWPDVWLTWC